MQNSQPACALVCGRALSRHVTRRARSLHRRIRASVTSWKSARYCFPFQATSEQQCAVSESEVCQGMVKPTQLHIHTVSYTVTYIFWNWIYFKPCGWMSLLILLRMFSLDILIPTGPIRWYIIFPLCDFQTKACLTEVNDKVIHQHTTTVFNDLTPICSRSHVDADESRS